METSKAPLKTDAAIRKRTQIAKTNRRMFVWIAVASALVGVASVVGYFMVQKLTYTERVLSTMQATVRTLEQNNQAVTSLQDNIRALDTNSDLASAKARSEDQAIQVILDALPSGANSDALGASLQSRLLAGIDGLSLESLQVDPVVGVETDSGATFDSEAPEVASDGIITFQFSVRGGQDQIRQVLTNLERSIRTIQVQTARLEFTGEGQFTLSVAGRAFYEPAKTIELTEKVQQ